MKEYEVVFSPEAGDDLLNLFDWIANAASPDTALSYIERIEAHCLSLKHVAERGYRHDDVRPSLRILGFERRITIAFTVESQRATILRVFYGGRNWEEVMS